MTAGNDRLELGGYRLLELLGRGGMSEVWLAEPLEGGARVALKRLYSNASAWPEPGRKLLEEAQVLAGFSHPNLVRIVDAGVEGGQHYLVMELLHGRSLADLLAAGVGPLPVGLVAGLALQLMSGLAAIHEAQDAQGRASPVVHRDIKPSNLFLTAAGELKIIDFGIALLPLADRTLTQTGKIRGSLPYCSPEQARGQVLGPRTDLFSAGLVLYELLTGERVFGQANEAALLTALLWNPIPPVNTVRPEVPARLAQFVARLLIKEPKQRTQSALAITDALRQASDELQPWGPADIAAWLANAPAGSPRPLPGHSPQHQTTHLDRPAAPRDVPSSAPPAVASPSASSRTERAFSPKRRTRWGLLAGALALVGAGGLGLWFWGPSWHAAAPPIGAEPPALTASIAPRASVAAESETLPASPSAPPPPAQSAQKPPPPTSPRPTSRIGPKRSPPPAAPQASSWLTVEAKPFYGRVILDGQEIGVTPLYRRRVPSGRHVLEVVREDGRVRRQSLDLSPDGERAVLIKW